MQSLCRRAKEICTKGVSDDKNKIASMFDKRAAQYKRIISLLQKLSKDVKRDKMQDANDDDDEPNLESLAAKVK